jgi:hypothetical protein
MNVVGTGVVNRESLTELVSENDDMVIAMYRLLFYLSIAVFIQGCAHISKPPDTLSRYLLKGSNYTFAIYNGDNALITYPMEDYLIRSKAMKREGSPYTDVFVIAHGWNFTIAEAISTYHQYIRAIDNHLASSSGTFRPFFVFVVWESVSRPILASAQSILPYGLADTITPIANGLDSVAFQIPSGWKQSINAYHNALGRDLPGSYIKRDDASLNHQNGTGRNFPVSEIIFNLAADTAKGVGGAPRIHVVGHSYGAKVIALSTIAALHKYERTTGLSPYGAVQSMILFNAAFHPVELNYLSYVSLAPILVPDRHVERYLRSVPRKGIVYSNSDYASGMLFGLDQIILNARQLQTVDSALDYDTGENGFLSWAPSPLRTYIAKPIIGALQLGWNVGTSVAEWGLRFGLQLPAEWWHHVQNNDTFGTNRLSKSLNSLHFFMPIDKLLNEDVDHQGIFRTTLPALGRSGFNQAKGHFRLPYLSDLGALETFVYDEDGKQKPSVQISSDVVARMACNTDWKQGNKFNDPDSVYAFDASEVFNNKFSPAGSHGDLRSDEEMACCVEKGLCQSPPAKIKGTCNIILNFIGGPAGKNESSDDGEAQGKPGGRATGATPSTLEVEQVGTLRGTGRL